MRIDERKFSEFASDPWNWLHRGRSHRAAAKLLEGHITDFWAHLQELSSLPGPHTISSQDFPGAYLMDSYWLCAAYSLECLLKGLCIRNDPTLVTETTLRIKSHNALWLAHRAQQSHKIDGLDAYFLKICEEKANWGAKYPVPLKFTEPKYHLMDGLGFFERFDRLYEIFELDLRQGFEGRQIGYQIGGKAKDRG